MPKGRPKKKTEKEKIVSKPIPKFVPKPVPLSKEAEAAEKATKALQSKLLTESALKKGGPGIRVRYAAEAGYVTTLEEINNLRKEAGLPIIAGLGALRKK